MRSGNFRTDMARAGAAMFFLPKVRAPAGGRDRGAVRRLSPPPASTLDHVNAHKHFHLHPTIAALMVKIGDARMACKGARVPLEPQARAARGSNRIGASAAVALTAPFARALRAPLPPRRHRRARSGVRPGLVGRDDGAAADGPDRTSARGLSEIYLHPATGAYPGSAPGYRYAEELAALTDPGMPALIAARDIRLAAFATFRYNRAERGGSGLAARKFNHLRQFSMSSPAFAIPPDLTRDTGVWPGDGPIQFGSDEHKRLFCKTLLDTLDPYKPAVLDWPQAGRGSGEAHHRRCRSGTSRCRPKTAPA